MMKTQASRLLYALTFAAASALITLPSMLVASDASAQEVKASEKKPAVYLRYAVRFTSSLLAHNRPPMMRVMWKKLSPFYVRLRENQTQ
jgi:hypothetical protein